jgi:hypothetical protein
MFDGSLPEIGDLAALSDAELVTAAGGWARAENGACARKLAVMAEIFARRTGLSAGERELWWIDPQAAVATEIGAAVNVSYGMALHQTHRGVALRDRLPTVAALFEAGLVSDLLVRTIVWRTYLITDEEAMAAVDAALGERITGWGALSVKKTEEAIDALVDQHDPAALRRSRESASSPTVEFGSPSDVAGTTSMWARLSAPDAALIEQRLDEMAHSVCPDDPRGIGERRAKALFAAVAEHTALACTCGQPDCAGVTSDDHVTKNAVVYVIAEQKTIDTAHAETQASTPATTEATTEEPTAEPISLAPAEESPPWAPTPRTAPPAYVFGAGVMPAPLLAATLERARFARGLPPRRHQAGAALHPLAGGVYPLPRPDLSVSRLRQTRPVLRP